jgi:hypothetical protein
MKILISTLASLLFASTAFGQANDVTLAPDTVTGTFVAHVNTATDDIRVDRVCLYRIDAASPDPTTEFACALRLDARAPTEEEAAPNGEGLVYEITFTTVLVPGVDQSFVARNIATDIGGEIMSDMSENQAHIPGRPFTPVFVIRAPDPSL